MKVNFDMETGPLERFERFCEKTGCGVLLFRQRETTEKVLDLAKMATAEGKISTNKKKVVRAIDSKWGIHPYMKALRLTQVKEGQIVGVIL